MLKTTFTTDNLNKQETNRHNANRLNYSSEWSEYSDYDKF